MLDEINEVSTQYAKFSIPNEEIHTKEGFSNWLQNPYTKLLMNGLKADYLDLFDEADNQIPTDTTTMIQTGINFGKRQAIEEVINWSPFADTDE